MKTPWILFLAPLLPLTATAKAEVKLPSTIADHMVLQRDRPIHIWGEASAGEAITVEFHDQKAGTVAEHLGTWSVYLPPAAAGGPFTLTIQGTNSIQVQDILVGDVWMASGQSNMEMPLAGWPGSPLNNSAMEIERANYPQIRFLRVHADSSEYPVKDLRVPGKWEVCTPDSAKEFSAIAYFFGRDLQAKVKVPIGLIDSTWGGTLAEAWTSMEGLSADASLMPVFAARAEDTAREETLIRKDAEANLARAKTNSSAEKAFHQSVESWGPAGLYNAMIAPLTEMPIRGVIWYQGEANASSSRAYLYDRVFPALITDWRKHWKIGNFPFLFVQLASFDAGVGDEWPLVREGQRKALQLVNTGMAVAIDVGSAKNVHPPDKQIVGTRLALLARSVAYGEKVESSGPLYRQAIPWAGGMQVWFDHAAGLSAKDGFPGGFEVAGDEGPFIAAEAVLEGETVVARSSAVPHPKFVRYGWKSFPERMNLYNGAGLPASPFTSATYPPLR
jgi:sialate O-acetylesterase